MLSENINQYFFSLFKLKLQQNGSSVRITFHFLLNFREIVPRTYYWFSTTLHGWFKAFY